MQTAGRCDGRQKICGCKRRLRCSLFTKSVRPAAFCAYWWSQLTFKSHETKLLYGIRSADAIPSLASFAELALVRLDEDSKAASSASACVLETSLAISAEEDVLRLDSLVLRVKRAS